MPPVPGTDQMPADHVPGRVTDAVWAGLAGWIEAAYCAITMSRYLP
jgi:hypothetical protein